MIVSGLGAGLMTWIWSPGVPVPDWIAIAAGHHAEFAVYGEARTEFTAPDAYGRSRPPREASGRNLSSYRDAARALLSGPDALTVRQLSGAKVNDMTPELDTLGVVLLGYLLDTKKAELLGFIKEGRGTKMEDRFQAAFKTSFEGMDAELKKHVGA